MQLSLHQTSMYVHVPFLIILYSNQYTSQNNISRAVFWMRPNHTWAYSLWTCNCLQPVRLNRQPLHKQRAYYPRPCWSTQSSRALWTSNQRRPWWQVSYRKILSKLMTGFVQKNPFKIDDRFRTENPFKIHKHFQKTWHDARNMAHKSNSKVTLTKYPKH